MRVSEGHCTFFLVFTGVFFLIQKSGLLGATNRSYSEIFFSPPFLAGATLLGVSLVILSVSRRSAWGRMGWLLPLGIFLVLAGLWTSLLTRVDLSLVIPEGQSMFVNSSIARSLGGYTGPLARYPDLYIKLVALKPEFSSDGRSIKKLSAEYVLLTRDGKSPRTLKRSSEDLPAFRSGFLVGFKEFGYAPRYVLKGMNGEYLDSAFVYLKVFPEGTEDYFRLMSPHTYYLRYYPGGVGVAKAAHFNLRVSRNKDLVLNRTVKLDEEVTFDGEHISFSEVKSWTKFHVIRDFGVIIALVGFGCLLVRMLMVVPPRLRNRRQSSSGTSDGA